MQRIFFSLKVFVLILYSNNYILIASIVKTFKLLEFSRSWSSTSVIDRAAYIILPILRRHLFLVTRATVLSIKVSMPRSAIAGIVRRSKFCILKSRWSPRWNNIGRIRCHPAGISPELSRNDNTSDFLKLGEIVDTFDIGSLSVRPIYGWKTIAIRLSGVRIDLRTWPSSYRVTFAADARLSILPASKCEIQRETSRSPELRWKQEIVVN